MQIKHCDYLRLSHRLPFFVNVLTLKFAVLLFLAIAELNGFNRQINAWSLVMLDENAAEQINNNRHCCKSPLSSSGFSAATQSPSPSNHFGQMVREANNFSSVLRIIEIIWDLVTYCGLLIFLLHDFVM